MTGRSRFVVAALAAAASISLGSAASAQAQGGGCGACSGRFAGYTQDILASSPSVYYPFNESGGLTAADDSGNLNNAAYRGSVSYGQPGVFADGSVTAVGTSPNGYVTHSNPLPPLISRADRTVEFWFNTTQTMRMTMFATGTQNPESAFTISLVDAAGPGGQNSPPGAGLYVQFYGDDIDIPFPGLTDGNWHYVAVTVSSMGTLVNVVIDGQQPQGWLWNGSQYPLTPASQSPSGFVMPFAVDTTAAPFTFGNTGWAIGFTGSLDLAAIYPTALAPSVLESHYQAGVGPVVTQVSPSSGPAGGGTTVTVSGSDLTGATAVAFGTAPAMFTVDGPTQITATSPPGSGTVDVTVTTPVGTSATSAADQFTYTTAPPVVSVGAPSLASVGAPSVTSSTTAAFSATVNPDGLPTSVQFLYGPVLPDTPFAYTGATAAQVVGPDFSDHVVSASATGLLPNTPYRVQAVATSTAGTATGPVQNLVTPADPSPPAPVLGRSLNVEPVAGLVLVKVPPGGFVPLTEVRQLPPGTEIDARLGTIKLTAATSAKKHGPVETGTFSGGVFGLAQNRAGIDKGLTTLSLLEGAFAGAPSYAECAAKPVADGARDGAHSAALSSKVLQTLRASAHGKFSTRGRYSAATVRGTVWSISDRCNGTLVAVQRDTVSVRDFVRRITILLHAHQSYLARAPGRRRK